MTHANPFAFADGRTEHHPHRLNLRTDPACALYVPGAELSLDLSDPLLGALDAALNARFTPEQRLVSTYGRLALLRNSADAPQRVRVASSTAHILGVGLSPLVDSASGPGLLLNFYSDAPC